MLTPEHGATTVSDAELKVGELARRTGLTVRALHHYDEIGLLSPSRRTTSGHRLYAAIDVKRLQQITSLRHLGLSLEEIRGCLEAPEWTLERTLQAHIESVRENILRQQRLGELLQTLLERVTTSGDASIESLIETIEMTATLERHYTDEQLRELARRRDTVGDDRMRQAGQEWQEVFAGYRRCMEAGLAPDHDDVQSLARRGAALVEEFTGGDAGLHASLSGMVEAEGGSGFMARMGMDVDEELWAYMGAASAALRRS